LTIGVAETEGQVTEIDTSKLEKRVVESIEAKMKIYMEELKQYRKEQFGKPKARGVVECKMTESMKESVAREFQKGEGLDKQKIKEQWTIAVPYHAHFELAGHLRDFVFVTDVVKGKPGETVNIPYVKDVEFQHVVAKTGTFVGKTGLVNVLTTTLHESGTYYDCYYGDIEKIDANLLDEINRVFAHGAIDAEDADLIALLDGITSAMFSSPGGVTRKAGGEDDTHNIVLGDTAGAGSSFQFRWIADGIAKLMQRGKDVRPGECILIIGTRNYGFMLKELAASQIVAFAKGEIITKGMVEDFLGVKIVVTRHRPSRQQTLSSYEQVYLLRPKRALALAPKRDILIETDKLIHLRQLRITASHTYGVARIDPSEVVRFCCGAFHTKKVVA